MIRANTRALAFVAGLVAASAATAEIVPFTAVSGSVNVYKNHFGPSYWSSTGKSGEGPISVADGYAGEGHNGQFGARSERNGSQITLGAKSSAASNGVAGESTFANASASYATRIKFTPGSGSPSGSPTTASVRWGLDGVVSGGEQAWFSFGVNGNGVYGTGAKDAASASDGAHSNLQYVEQAEGVYSVTGDVDFDVALFADDGGFYADAMFQLDTAAQSLDGMEAFADFFNTAVLEGVFFPEFGGQSADDLGFALEFLPLHFDEIALGGEGGGPRGGGQQTPEPATLAAWLLAFGAGVAFGRGKRNKS
jgi:hypothetical protein